jgi:hypothetical protein
LPPCSREPCCSASGQIHDLARTELFQHCGISDGQFATPSLAGHDDGMSRGPGRCPWQPAGAGGDVADVEAVDVDPSCLATSRSARRRETLDLLGSRETGVWVHGNCEREVVTAYDGLPVPGPNGASAGTAPAGTASSDLLTAADDGDP